MAQRAIRLLSVRTWNVILLRRGYGGQEREEELRVGTMRYKVLKAAANPAPDLDLNLSGGSEVKTKIKSKVMRVKGGANPAAANGDAHPVACHYHKQERKLRLLNLNRNPNRNLNRSAHSGKG